MKNVLVQLLGGTSGKCFMKLQEKLILYGKGKILSLVELLL